MQCRGNFPFSTPRGHRLMERKALSMKQRVSRAADARMQRAPEDIRTSELAEDVWETAREQGGTRGPAS